MPVGLLIVVLFLVVLYLLTFGFRVLRHWLQEPSQPSERKEGK